MLNETCSAVTDLEQNLKRQRGGAKSDLVEAVFRYEMSLGEPESALCQRGISQPAAALPLLISVRKEGSLSDKLNLQNFALNEYEACKSDFNHRGRRKKLETIIQTLQPYLEDSNHERAGQGGDGESLLKKVSERQVTESEDDDSLRIILAKSYLHRSLLFRPKGFTVPARKIEALHQVKRLTREVLKKDETNIEALRGYLHAALELQKAGEALPSHFEDSLETAALAFQSGEPINGPEDLLLLLAYAKTCEDPSVLEPVLKETRTWERPFDLSLFKARAAFRMGRLEEVGAHLKEALKNPPGPLADPFWEDLLDLFKSLREREWDGWELFALQAVEQCRSRELKIGNNVYLAWHWSRMAELYQIAFSAETEISRKISLVDSLKSRPMVRYQALSEIAESDQTVRAFLEQEYNARDGRYVKQPGQRVRMNQRPKSPSHDELPEEWIAVHFFLDGNGRGHAMSLDRRRPEGQRWQLREFRYGELHKAFLEWQEALVSGSELSVLKGMLSSLCSQIGRSLPFLFCESFLSGNRPVLWIPHGFLHRLPLHAAIDPESRRLPFADRVCRYLPAWDQFRPQTAPLSGEKVIFRHFPENEFPKLETAVGEDAIKTAEAASVFAGLGEATGTFALLCHGKCDLSNPFRSRLILADENLPLQSLLGVAKVNGSRVLLGACESDMVPPVLYPADEHLSLSTALLSGGARDVVAGLWWVQDEKVDALFSHILSSKDAAAALAKWRGEMGTECRSDEDRLRLFLSAPFRVMGSPAA